MSERDREREGCEAVQHGSLFCKRKARGWGWEEISDRRRGKTNNEFIAQIMPRLVGIINKSLLSAHLPNVRGWGGRERERIP